MPEKLEENVRRVGYTKPTPIQQHAIPVVTQGRDLMACAQTGSGKTAAFLLPILAHFLSGEESFLTSELATIQSPNAIVVAPTRELAVQICNEAKKFACGTTAKACVVYGGVSVQYQLDTIRKGCDVLIGTPGRLLDFIGKRAINLDRVKYVVFDEADRMLDLGFEPDMRKLMASKGLPDKGDRQTLMFSATFPKEIQQMATDFLTDTYVFVTVGIVGGANPDVQQNVVEVKERGAKSDMLLEVVNTHKESNSVDEAGNFIKKTLVFVQTKRMADLLGALLCLDGYPSTTMHGDRDQRQREEALRRFKSGQCPVLIATAVAGRGLDIKGVDHVINYDLPTEIEDYVHRIGRTGRVGNTGVATSFFDPEEDGELVDKLVKVLAEANQTVPEFLSGGRSDLGGQQQTDTNAVEDGGWD